MKNLYTLIPLLLIGSLAPAQVQKCATMPNRKTNSEKIGGYAQRIGAAEEKARQWTEQHLSNAKTQSTLVVPVVFHCVYKNTSDPTYLPDSVFQRQINILNETYSLSNPNYINTRAIFDTLGANIDVQFCFASVDPQGNPTSGIDRVQSAASFSLTPYDEGVKNPASGGVAPWDAQHYFNVWTCDMSIFGQTVVLGYSSFPGGPDSLDGVVLQYQYVGYQNTGNSNNLGRTLVHESGHWFGLRHIWGDGQQSSVPCDSTDYVADTPHADNASQSDCDTTKNTCAAEDTFWTQWGIDPPDMVENYMDYSSDGCMTMFTKGQKARMWSFINTVRTGLLSNPVSCGVVGVQEYNPAFGDFIRIFPNPASDLLNLNFATNSIDQFKVDFYNAGGQLVKSLVPSGFQNTVDISGFCPGIYFIKISNPSNCAVKRFLVQ